MEQILMFSNARRGEFYFVKRDAKTRESMMHFVHRLKHGNGLLSYKEITDHMYILPNISFKNDEFFMFSMRRLDHTYAADRLYAAWARHVVGNYESTGFYYNTAAADVITYTFFDLASLYQSKHTEELYREANIVYNPDVKINDITGKYVSGWFVREINFNIGYYYMAVNSFYLQTSKQGLVDRAELLQVFAR